MLTRRSLLGAMAGAAVSCGTGPLVNRPNLLFLISDDHRHDVLRCGGDQLAETPNLDYLAKGGTRFSHHFVNCPMCTPSRQSVLTGLLPHAAGVSTLQTALSESRQTLAEQLRGSGYETAAFGKMHFNAEIEPGMHGFETALCDGAITKAWHDEVEPREPEEGIATKPAWKPFRDPARIWLNADQLPYPRYDKDTLASFITRKAVGFLKREHERPFAAWVSYKQPHSPFDFPIEWRDRYNPAAFQVPKIGPDDAWQVPLIFRDLSDADKQGIAAAYYTAVSYMDAQVGQVLTTLQVLGLAENTVVVYWGDNGYSLGEHGRFEKHCFYEPAIRVPLIVRWPGQVREGAVVDALTESGDITPTILDLLGVEAMSGAQGRALTPYLMETGEPARQRDHVFSEYLHNEEACVRTHKWKLVYCSGKRKRDDGYETDSPTPGRYTRLYNLEEDPDEFLDESATKPGVVTELLALMLRRFRTTHPEANTEPKGLSVEDALDWYLPPRDDSGAV